MRCVPRVLARATALCLALVGATTGVLAQEWATKALCNPPRIAVFDEAFAPETRTELDARAAEIPNSTGRFWQVTAPNGAISHLWGTMHSSHRSVLDMPDQVLETLQNARRVALEIDPTHPDRQSYSRFIKGDGLYRPLRSNFRFADLSLPREIERHLGNRLVALGWPRQALDELTFGGLSELLLFDPCEDFSAGGLPTQDSYIQTLAHIAGIPILGLEPVDRLPRKLNQPENADLARALIATYAVYLLPDATTEQRATAFALYQEGRVGLSMVWDAASVIHALGDDGPDLYRTMTDYLVDERNADFVAAARSDLDRGGLFVAVGNFHLPGTKGMVEMLRGEGFKVTRIPLPGEVP